MEREKLVKLVQGMKDGDEAALSEIYTEFYDDLYYYIYKTVNDPELAADLTQDTFIEILQSIGSLQEPAAFVTWSRQLAFRRCTAYFKKRHDLLADEDEDGYSVFDTAEEERTEFIPDAAMDQADFRQTVMAMINELPEEQRSAIMLRYFEERPVSEIAEIQGVSEGTVKSRLNYGRKSIKQAVENYEKKSGVKLHCVGIVPLLLWLLREMRKEKGLSLTTGAAKTAAVGVAASAAAGTTAAAAATAAAGAAIGTKLAAIVAAAVVAVGGLGYGVSQIFADCDHRWVDSTCQECGKVCEHDRYETEQSHVAAGIRKTERECDDCGFVWDEYALEHIDEPIHVQLPLDLVTEYITEKSHASMLNLLKDYQNVTEESGITVELVGTLYFFNEEWVDRGNNNRLIFVYHLQDGIVPGGWYTFLGGNGNMAIQSFKNDAGEQYFSTVANGDYYDYMSYLWIECHKEAYSFWIDTDYPVSFVHEGKRYVGHQTVDDMMQSLYINSFGDFKLEFDHMIATGKLKDMVSEF